MAEDKEIREVHQPEKEVPLKERYTYKEPPKKVPEPPKPVVPPKR
ncbi:MAG: hypothetical protein V1724_06085 [Chloroflexota bacterium]